MAQRAIALALKLLVLNLLRKFKVHDEGLSRPRTIIIGNSFRGAVEPKVLLVYIRQRHDSNVYLNFLRKFRHAAEVKLVNLQSRFRTEGFRGMSAKK